MAERAAGSGANRRLDPRQPRRAYCRRRRGGARQRLGGRKPPHRRIPAGSQNRTQPGIGGRVDDRRQHCVPRRTARQPHSAWRHDGCAFRSARQQGADCTGGRPSRRGVCAYRGRHRRAHFYSYLAAERRLDSRADERRGRIGDCLPMRTRLGHPRRDYGGHGAGGETRHLV